MSFFRVIAFLLAFFAVLSSMIYSSVIYAATLVSTEEASRLLINPERSSPALVVSLNQGNIPAQTSGVISEIVAKVGDSFKQGETLARIDCVDNISRKKAESAKFSQANTELMLSKRELARGEKLVQQKNIGEAELDKLTSAVKVAQSLLNAQQAVLDMAALNVERCNIKSPYDGVVTKRIASTGEMIEYGKPVVEMIEMAELEVSAKIANSDEVSFNEAVAFVIDVNDEQFSVTLRTFLPIIETHVRSREARFVFSDKTAIAGSTGRLRWQSPLSYLPAHLLQKRDGKNGYFIVENANDKKLAKFIPVSSAEEGRPLLFNGTPNTNIVTDGRYGLNDGDEVELTTQSTQTTQTTKSHGDK